MLEWRRGFMPSYTDTDLRDAVRELILNDKSLRDEITERWKADPATGKTPEKRPVDVEGYRINKWTYAVMGGLTGLFLASDPGGLNELQGYGLGFVSVYLALSLLELLAQRSLGRRHS